MAYYSRTIQEEELKNKVREEWFSNYDNTEIPGKVDFYVGYENNTYLWAEAKRGVTAEIYTHQPVAQLQLDIQRHDSQYAPIPVHVLPRSHDRFLLIDDEVYHIGASIKDLGKRWFAIMKMQEVKADEILGRL